MKKQNIPCPECGSANTELRDSRPGATPAEDLKNRFVSLLASGLGAGRSHFGPGRGRQGRHYLVCRDCGAVSCINVL